MRLLRRFALREDRRAEIDSPMPLAPIGWCGDGVTVSPGSGDGYSIDVGSE